MPSLRRATALWFGFDHLLPYLFYASLLGGALTLLLLSVSHAALAAVSRRPAMGAASA